MTSAASLTINSRWSTTRITSQITWKIMMRLSHHFYSMHPYRFRSLLKLWTVWNTNQVKSRYHCMKWMSIIRKLLIKEVRAHFLPSLHNSLWLLKNSFLQPESLTSLLKVQQVQVKFNSQVTTLHQVSKLLLHSYLCLHQAHFLKNNLSRCEATSPTCGQGLPVVVSIRQGPRMTSYYNFLFHF